MAVPFVLPLLEAAGTWLSGAATAVAGGAATAGVLSASGDTTKDQSKAQPAVRAIPKTDEPCKKCPPDGGAQVRRNHSMKPEPRAYQGKITGFPYDTANSLWSMEWSWLDTDFDGFKSAECLLQEAKGNCDQFMDDDGEPKFFFQGFDTMKDQINKQAALVKANPPAKLMWYFQTPLAWEHMIPVLSRAGVPSVYQP